MNYKLQFLPKALKAFKKLNPDTRSKFKKQLKARLKSPKIEKHRLHGDYQGYYKIKLQSIGYRLIYKVIDKKCIVLVVEVDRRDKIYKNH